MKEEAIGAMVGRLRREVAAVRVSCARIDQGFGELIERLDVEVAPEALTLLADVDGTFQFIEEYLALLETGVKRR